MKRLSAPLALALALALAAPAPTRAAPPTTSVWGYSGLVTLPTALTLEAREFSLGAAFVTKGPIWRLVPHVALAPIDGLELGLNYAVPGPGNGMGVSAFGKYQLLKPTAGRPTGVALGASLIGFGGTDRYVDGNQVYLVVSHDFNWTIDGRLYTLASLHGGFMGSFPAFTTRAAGGLEIPVGEAASVFGEVLGPAGPLSAYWNAGASWRFGPGFAVRAYTMGNGNPTGWTDRDYAISLGYTGRWPDFGKTAAVPVAATPTPYMVASLSPPTAPRTPEVIAPTPPVEPQEPVVAPPTPSPSAPPSARPTPSPSPSAKPSLAPAGPEAVVQGLVLDDQGRALPNYRVGVVALNRSVRTDARGHYAMKLPAGTHELVVWDGANARRLARPIKVAVPAGLTMALVVSVPMGAIQGAVLDAKSRQPIAGAAVTASSPAPLSLKTGQDGTFKGAEVPLGTYALSVSAPGFEVAEVKAELKGPGDRPLLVALSPLPGVVSGQVTGPGAAGAPVVVRVQGTGLATVPDAQGRFRLADVPPGTQVLQVMRGGALLAQRVVVLGPGQALATEIAAPLPSPSPKPSPTPTPRPTPQPSARPSAAATAAPTSRTSAALTGRVTDAAGAPLGGVKLVLEGPELTVLTVSDAQGRFSVADVPLGRYTLTSSKAGYRTDKTAVALVTPGAKPLAVRLSR